MIAGQGMRVPCVMRLENKTDLIFRTLVLNNGLNTTNKYFTFKKKYLFKRMKQTNKPVSEGH